MICRLTMGHQEYECDEHRMHLATAELFQETKRDARALEAFVPLLVSCDHPSELQGFGGCLYC